MAHSEEQPLLYDEVSSKVVAWSAVIFCVLGIVGNATTLFVLMKTRSLRQHPTTPYLMSLFLSDLIFSGFNLPLSAHKSFHRDWIFATVTCAAFQFLTFSRVAVTGLSMMILSLNRFRALNFPGCLTTFFTQLRPCLGVLGLWTVSLAVPGLLACFQNGNHYTNNPDCTFIKNNEEHWALILQFALFVGIPCLVMMTISCCSIICKVLPPGSTCRSFSESSDARLREDRSVGHMIRTREKDLTKTIVTMCACYIVILISVCISWTMTELYKKPVWWALAHVMFWFSVIVNPVIYFVVYEYYRQQLLYNVRWLLCMNPQDPSTTNSNVQSIRQSRSNRGSIPPPERSNPEEQEPLAMQVIERETVIQFRRSEPVRLTLTNSKSRQQLPMYENVRLQSSNASVIVRNIDQI